MPCYQTEESNNEKESRRISKLIIIFDKKLGIETAKNIIEWSTAFYENHCNVVAPLLCAKINSLLPHELEKVVFNGRDKESRMLADWFDEHNDFDKKRLKTIISPILTNPNGDIYITCDVNQKYPSFAMKHLEKYIEDINKLAVQTDFKIGQDAFYQLNQVTIEDIFGDGTCKINNPLWSDEDDDEIPFWITVKLTELRHGKI